MTSRSSKVAYVKSQGQTRSHGCHWPGCKAQVPPALWGCKRHWFALPKALRDRIWATYRIGQEKTLSPSREYLAAADAVEKWIQENAKPKPQRALDFSPPPLSERDRIAEEVAEAEGVDREDVMIEMELDDAYPHNGEWGSDE